MDILQYLLFFLNSNADFPPSVMMRQAFQDKRAHDALSDYTVYSAGNKIKIVLDLFAAGFATEDETAAEIKRVYDEKQVYRRSLILCGCLQLLLAYVQKTDDHTLPVIAQTVEAHK